MRHNSAGHDNTAKRHRDDELEVHALLSARCLPCKCVEGAAFSWSSSSTRLWMHLRVVVGNQDLHDAVIRCVRQSRMLVLGHPSLPNSFVIFSTVVVQGLIGLLPGNIGGMEGTHLFIFNLLRIGSNASLVYTIILRMGQMTMVLLGLGFIFMWRLEKVRVRGADRNRTDV